jgi:hypothetical protein
MGSAKESFLLELNRILLFYVSGLMSKDDTASRLCELLRSGDLLWAPFTINSIRQNKMVFVIEELLDLMDCKENTLAHVIQCDVSRSVDMLRSFISERDHLLRIAVDVFERNGIVYVVFKTPDRFLCHTADVDVLIDPSQYSSAVDALLKYGFYCIDDLSKTYATGFMLPRNRIILDLQTGVTFGGISYIDEWRMLEGRERRDYLTLDGEAIPVEFVNTVLEAVVRIGHSVIKEWRIDLIDFAHVIRALVSKSDELCREIVVQSLTFASSVVAASSSGLLAGNGLRQLACRMSRLSVSLGSGWVKDLAYRYVASKVDLSVPPIDIHPMVSFMALGDRLRSRGEMPLGGLPILNALFYAKNRIRAGQKLMHHMKEFLHLA